MTLSNGPIDFDVEAPQDEIGIDSDVAGAKAARVDSRVVSFPYRARVSGEGYGQNLRTAIRDANAAQGFALYPPQPRRRDPENRTILVRSVEVTRGSPFSSMLPKQVMCPERVRSGI
jgi:hypothetical protein